jgi:hypothetical protein
MLTPLAYFTLRNCDVLLARAGARATLQLVIYSGGGETRTVAFWKLGDRTLRLALAADA